MDAGVVAIIVAGIAAVGSFLTGWMQYAMQRKDKTGDILAKVGEVETKVDKVEGTLEGHINDESNDLARIEGALDNVEKLVHTVINHMLPWDTGARPGRDVD